MSGIGDLLLITPALRSLHHLYPNADFDIVTYNLDNAQFFFRLPYVKKGYEFPLFDLELKRICHPKFWYLFGNTTFSLRKNEYDIYISFHHTWLPQWYLFELGLAKFSGAKFKVGINPEYVPHDGVFDRSIKESTLGDRHYLSFFHDLVRLLGETQYEYETIFPLDSGEIEEAGKVIRSGLNHCQKRVCLHVGASHTSQRWPLDHYIELARRLVNEEVGIVLIGSKAERNLTKQIEEKLPKGKCLNSAGETDLFQMGALIETCDLFIGNDSGPMHVSIARKKPTIGLIGPGRPRYHNYPPGKTVILKNPIQGAPCDGLKFKETIWNWAISPDQVFTQAMRMLQ